MKSLSGLDATFLYLETPETPMHVGSLNLYELPKGFKGSFRQAVRDGRGATVLANAVLDLGPTPRDVPPADPSRKRRTASDLQVGEMIGAVFSNSLAQYAKLARSLPAAVTSLGGTVARQSVSGAG